MYFYLKDQVKERKGEIQRDLPSFSLLPNGWACMKPGVCSGFLTWVQGPSTWVVVFHCFPRYIGREWDQNGSALHHTAIPFGRI